MTQVRNTLEISADLMKDLLKSKVRNGIIHLKGFRSVADGLGGVYSWEALHNKDQHDGKYVIDPDNEADLDAWDAGAQAIWATAGVGFGCYVMLERADILQKSSTVALADAGVTNAYIIPTLRTDVVDGLSVTVKFANSNTDEATIQVGNLPPVPVLTVTGAALPAGYLVATSPTLITYEEATGSWKAGRAPELETSTGYTITKYEDGTFYGKLHGSTTLTGITPAPTDSIQMTDGIISKPYSYTYVIGSGGGVWDTFPVSVIPATGTAVGNIPDNEARVYAVPKSAIIGTFPLVYELPISGYWYNPA